MFGRIFPYLLNIILIAIFLVLFKLSLTKVDDFTQEMQAQKVADNVANNLASKLNENEKALFRLLPCRTEIKNCPDTSVLQKRSNDLMISPAVRRTLILNQEGTEIFSARKIDAKYNPLLAEAQTKGASYQSENLKNNLKDESKIIIIKKVNLSLDSNGDNKFILFLIDKDKLPFSNYKIIFSVITLIPFFIILVYLTRRSSRGKSRKSKKSAGEKDYLVQIEELKTQNARQSQFLTNFTHELRTPLNAIIGFSGLLKDQTLGQLGNPEYMKYANDINTSGVHLLSLINDILDYSKSELGKLKINMTEVDVVKIVKQSLSIVSPRASESRVELLQSFSNDYCIVRLDPKRFKQIMLNLLSNSVKFTPDGGNVTVSIFPDIKGEKISIEVKDTGVGIAEKDIPTVMSLFGQVETDLNRKYEGTGIGLPFAKKLTDLMGGIFNLQSKVGVGTSITLTFDYDKRLNIEYQELYKKS